MIAAILCKAIVLKDIIVSEYLNVFSGSRTDTWLIIGTIILAWLTFKYLRGEKKDCKQVTKRCEGSLADLAKTAYLPGNAEKLIRMIEKNKYDVNVPIILPAKLSLFLCSCLSGERTILSYMLRKGADVLAVTRDLDSALYLATFGILHSNKPDISILQTIINAGGKVNKQNSRGFTPLHRAASCGNITVINCLLRNGADPNIPNVAGVFPIDSAINAGYLSAAEMLQINVDTRHHVWEVVNPHTPVRIQMGLLSPHRRLMLQTPQRKTIIESPPRKISIESPHSRRLSRVLT